MKNAGLWILVILVVGGLAWWIFGGKPKTNQTRTEPSNPPSEPRPIASIVNQVRKNTKGTLSLVGINTLTREVVSSKELSFEEAVKIVGNVTDVCVGKYNAGSAYVQCSSVRKA